VEEIRAIIWVEPNQTITKANNSTKFLTSLTNRKTIPKKKLGTTVIVRNHLPSAVSIKHILAKNTSLQPNDKLIIINHLVVSYIQLTIEDHPFKIADSAQMQTP